MVQEHLAQNLPMKNLGVMQADFIVLRGTQMPSGLIEVGFLTNPREERLLRKDKIQTNISRAIQKAVVAYEELMSKKQLQPKGSGTSQ